MRARVSYVALRASRGVTTRVKRVNGPSPDNAAGVALGRFPRIPAPRPVAADTMPDVCVVWVEGKKRKEKHHGRKESSREETGEESRRQEGGSQETGEEGCGEEARGEEEISDGI